MKQLLNIFDESVEIIYDQSGNGTHAIRSGYSFKKETVDTLFDKIKSEVFKNVEVR